MSGPVEPAPSDPGGLGPEPRLDLFERYRFAQKAEGILAPVLTALLAFIVGGLVVAAHDRQEPDRHVQGDLRRLRPRTGSSRG